MRVRLYLNCFFSNSHSNGHPPQQIIFEIDIEYTYFSLLSVFLKMFLSVSHNESKIPKLAASIKCDVCMSITHGE